MADHCWPTPSQSLNVIVHLLFLPSPCCVSRVWNLMRALDKLLRGILSSGCSSRCQLQARSATGGALGCGGHTRITSWPDRPHCKPLSSLLPYLTPQAASLTTFCIKFLPKRVFLFWKELLFYHWVLAMCCFLQCIGLPHTRPSCLD